MGKNPYPKEFRDEVVAIAHKGDSPVAQIARDFGISTATIYEWIKQTDRQDRVATPAGKGVDDVQLRELKRRNKQLEQELEVLRRATAYFSQAVLPK